MCYKYLPYAQCEEESLKLFKRDMEDTKMALRDKTQSRIT